MKNSRSEAWADLRDLEDVLALLAGLDQERRLIKRRAWEIGDGETFAASERQRVGLAQLKALLSARWHELVERASE